MIGQAATDLERRGNEEVLTAMATVVSVVFGGSQRKEKREESRKGTAAARWGSLLGFTKEGLGILRGRRNRWRCG
jgi:hypothetical protein